MVVANPHTSVTPAAQLSIARRLERRAGRTSVIHNSVSAIADRIVPKWNDGWNPDSESRNSCAIRGDIPFTYESIQIPHATSATRPNVRMPNQSSAPENPRFSESTSSAASNAKGTSSGIAYASLGSGITMRLASITSETTAGTCTPGSCSPPLKPRPRVHSIHRISGNDGHANQSRFLR
jgi:hypothetical protein